MKPSITDWISALTSLLLLILGAWTVFFSPASQAVVEYFQSELAIKNAEVMELNGKRRALEYSISDLKETKTALLSDIQHLRLAQSKLKTELSKSEFRLVRNELAGRSNMLTQLDAKILNTTVLMRQDDLAKPLEVSINVWDELKAELLTKAKALPKVHQAISKKIIQRWLKECSGAASHKVHLLDAARPPPVGHYAVEEKQYKNRSERVSDFAEKAIDAQTKFISCLRNLKAP